jgi:hypothetical protein
MEVILLCDQLVKQCRREDRGSYQLRRRIPQRISARHLNDN